jgi:hypothetical protein
MRIRYKILWIEDDPDYVNELRPELISYMDSLGFNLSIVHLPHGDDQSMLPKNDFEYDLILVDYNLSEDGKGSTGDTIIKLIRSDLVIIEAIFYSSNTSLKLDEILPKTQRISHHLGKTGLPEKIKQIIELTIRKVQDVNNMRGLVIAEVIDLEIKMKSILSDFFTANDDGAKKQELVAKKLENLTNALKRVEKYDASKVLDFIEEHHTINDHCSALVRLINYIIKAVGSSSIEGETQKNTLGLMRDELEKIRKDAIDLRNIMAHAVEQEEGDKIILKSKNGGKVFNFNTQECIKVRQDLRKHSISLEQVAEQIKGNAIYSSS